MTFSFQVIEQVLSDDSRVYDLVAEDDDAFVIAWNAPSNESAKTSADVLNEVLEGFQLCGSDLQIAALAEKIRAAIAHELD